MALSEKKAITDKRHQDKLDKIKIQPYKNQGAAIRAAAAAAGQSLQGYILQAVRARMEQEGQPLEIEQTPAGCRGYGAGPLCLSGATLPGHPLDFTAFRW